MKIKNLCYILLPKMTGCVINLDDAKTMSFLFKDEELFVEQSESYYYLKN